MHSLSVLLTHPSLTTKVRTGELAILPNLCDLVTKSPCDKGAWWGDGAGQLLFLAGSPPRAPEGWMVEVGPWDQPVQSQCPILLVKGRSKEP